MNGPEDWSKHIQSSPNLSLSRPITSHLFGPKPKEDMMHRVSIVANGNSHEGVVI